MTDERSAHEAPDDERSLSGTPPEEDALERTIRSGLREATSTVGETTATGLAATLAERRDAAGPHSRRTRYLAVAAAVAVVTVAVASGLWLAGGDDSGVEVVTKPPSTAEPVSPFDGYEPGWHEIDPGPVPAMAGASMAWTGSEIIVAGSSFAEGPSLVPDTQAFAYDPATRTWRQLPDPPLAFPTIVDADGTLVAVGPSEETAGTLHAEQVWATLDLSTPGDTGTSEQGWILLGPVKTAPELTAIGTDGPNEPSGRPTVLWTGEKVIDVTHGSVLDPDTGTSVPLAMPSDVIGYSHLIATNAVWTGDEVVLIAWDDADGLAWDPSGGTVRTVEGPQEPTPAAIDVVEEATAVGGDGKVALIEWTNGESSANRTMVLDTRTGAWRELPPRPISPERSYCPLKAAFVAGDLVVPSCNGTDAAETPPIRLHDGRWIPLAEPPWSEPCCMGIWLGTDEALITWATDTDTLNNPEAPYARGAIWIPR